MRAIGPDSYSSPTQQCTMVECWTLDEALLKAGVYWLAMKADRTQLDAVIVVPHLADAHRLSCALPAPTLEQLVAGNIVRMNRGSLFLITPSEVTASARQHAVVLGVGLSPRELARVSRMNPAEALHLNPVQDTRFVRGS
jgi:hypothetical protein